MKQIVFDRLTGPSNFNDLQTPAVVYSYPHTPVRPNLQSHASEQTLLVEAARRVGLSPIPPLRDLRQRFEIRALPKPEWKAIAEFFFGAERDANNAAREARLDAARAIRNRIMLKNVGSSGASPITPEEWPAFLDMLRFPEAL